MTRRSQHDAYEWGMCVLNNAPCHIHIDWAAGHGPDTEYEDVEIEVLGTVVFDTMKQESIFIPR